MHKLTGFLVLFLFSFSFSNAQVTKVMGSVKDTTSNLSVSNAVVALISPKDSVLKSFTRTAPDGTYTLSNVSQGNYILMVMHPMFGDYVDNIEIKSNEETLPLIPLTSKSKLLTNIIIKSGSPIKIKGDTTIYTADSFKVSANANVEELLKKLPGIQVDKNGEIKAMGEKVEKVLVDGEEFFGDDPGMAVKNLRADAVKEVQVFDKKSEQAEFTGIDDGKTQKTINLKLKEDKKKGHFGKIDVSGGLMKDIDDRYNNNLLYSSFKGKRKFSAFFLNGNTGQDGLSWQDGDKYGISNDNVNTTMDEDGGFMYSWNGGSVDDEPYVNTENGFIKNINAGINYNNKWNDKQTLSFTPKYNDQDYTNTTRTLTQQQIDNSILTTNAIDTNNIRRHNFKNRLVYDVKIDSANSLKITANANFYHTESETLSKSSTGNTTGFIINSRDAVTRNNSDKNALNANVVFKHKFKKARRTLTFTTDWNHLNTDGLKFNESYNLSFEQGLPSIQLIDQMIDNNKSTDKLTGKLVYTEPLTKKYSLELGYQLSYDYGKNNQVTYTESVPGKYDVQVDTLTNKFTSKIWVNTPSAKISYSNKKIKYNFGMGVGFTNYDLIDETFNKDYLRNYTNFFPAAGFTYNYKSNHSLKINYNGSTTQPTINQLQPLRNNNDKFNQYIGNPDLKPSFQNSVNLQHNGYNFIKDLWTYQSLNISFTSNSFTNNIVIDTASGVKTTQPVNTDGNINMFLWAGAGKQKIKKLNMGIFLGVNVNYNRFSNYLNNRKSTSNTTGAGLSIGLNKSKDKKYELSLNNDLNYNINTTTENSNNNHYLTNTVSANATVYYKKVWSISSDYQYYVRGKTSQNDKGINNSLWNAKLQRTFKNNEFTVYVKVRDILNQNIGVDRNFYGNTFTEVRNDRLKRYFMVGFAWDFKNKNKSSDSKK
ncbi:MAG: TonB-dependent receptor [Bacteroidetes bacterium]|nr:TonB-dependent receptor [Bacteroidota bacterium]